MKWTTKKNNYECVEMIIVTDNTKKDLCAKVEFDETLNTYSHIFDNKMDEIVDTINKLNQNTDKS